MKFLFALLALVVVSPCFAEIPPLAEIEAVLSAPDAPEEHDHVKLDLVRSIQREADEQGREVAKDAARLMVKLLQAELAHTSMLGTSRQPSPRSYSHSTDTLFNWRVQAFWLVRSTLDFNGEVRPLARDLALRHPDPFLRNECLSTLPSEAAGAFEILRRVAETDPHPTNREHSLSLMVSIGERRKQPADPRVIDFLIAIAEKENAPVGERTSAIRALREIGPANEKIAEALFKLAESYRGVEPGRDKRRFVSGTTPWAQMKNALYGYDNEFAVWKDLAPSFRDRAIKLFREEMAGPEFEAGFAAARSLVSLGDSPDVVETFLIDHTRTGSAEERGQAVSALSARPLTEKTKIALNAAFQDEVTRPAASYALLRQGIATDESINWEIAQWRGEKWEWFSSHLSMLMRHEDTHPSIRAKIEAELQNSAVSEENRQGVQDLIRRQDQDAARLSMRCKGAMGAIAAAH